MAAVATAAAAGCKRGFDALSAVALTLAGVERAFFGFDEVGCFSGEAALPAAPKFAGALVSSGFGKTYTFSCPRISPEKKGGKFNYFDNNKKVHDLVRNPFIIFANFNF